MSARAAAPPAAAADAPAPAIAPKRPGLVTEAGPFCRCPMVRYSHRSTGRDEERVPPQHTLVVLALNEGQLGERSREGLYVGLSRARDQLVVCGDPAFVEEVGGTAVLRQLRRSRD